MEDKSRKQTRFDSVYEQYKNQVLKTAAHYINVRENANEVMQETFIELYVHWEDVEKDKIENWLVKVAKNKSLNWNKKMMRELPGSEPEESGRSLFTSQNPEEEVLHKMYKETIGKFSEELFTALYRENVRWYEAVRLVYGLRLSYQQAAKEMGISIAMLNSMLYRARRWAKKNYEAQYRMLKDGNI